MITAETLRTTPLLDRYPSDLRVRDGIVVTQFDDTVAGLVDLRLKECFGHLEADTTKHFGEVVAYTLGLDLDGQVQLSDHMFNYGVNAKPDIELPGSGDGCLWAMKLGNHNVELRRAIASIVFNNGEIVNDSSVYSLRATRH